MPRTPQEEAELRELKAMVAQLPDDEPAPAAPAAPAPAVAPAAAQEPADGPGILARAWEAVRPTEGRNEALEQLPDWVRMPELTKISTPMAKALAGTLATGPEETAAILKAQFPKLGVRQEGRYIVFKSAEDGSEYAWKPGIRFSDIARGAVGAAATVPIALAAPAGIVGGLGAGALGAAAMEGGQALTGGEFDAVPVLAGGVMGAAVPAVGSAIRGARGMLAGRAAAAAPQTADDVAGAMLGAARGNADDAARLAAAVDPNPAVLADAADLGVTLQPDQVSRNPAVVQALRDAQAVAGSPLREAAESGEEAFLKRARDLFNEWGAQAERGEFDKSLGGRMSASMKGIEKQVNDAYEVVNKGIPAGSPAAAPNAVQYIEQRAKDLGGAQYLTKPEKKLLASLKDGLTTDRLNMIRKQIGAQTQRPGPLKDSGIADQLYGEIKKDYALAAERYGQKEALEAAEGVYQQKLALRKDIASVFGGQLDETLNGSAASRLEQAVGEAAKGSDAKFGAFMRSVPEEARPEAAVSGLLYMLGKGGKPIDTLAIATVADAFERSPVARTAVMSQLPQAAREGLPKVFRVAQAIRNAAAVKGDAGRLTSALKGAQAADGLISKIGDLAVDVVAKGGATLGGAAGAAIGGPAAVVGAGIGSSVGAGLGKVAANYLTGKNIDKTQLVMGFLMSPEGSALIRGVAAQAPIKQGLIRRVVNSSPRFVRLMDAAGVPPSQRARWLATAITSSVSAQTAEQMASKTPIEE